MFQEQKTLIAFISEGKLHLTNKKMVNLANSEEFIIIDLSFDEETKIRKFMRNNPNKYSLKDREENTKCDCGYLDKEHKWFNTYACNKKEDDKSNEETERVLVIDREEETGGTIYSNFNHEFELDGNESTFEEVEEHLKKNPDLTFGHPAWDFYSTVWYANEEKKFKTIIKRYRVTVDELEDESLKELIEETNNKYGND